MGWTRRTSSVAMFSLLAPVPVVAGGCIVACPDVYYADGLTVTMPRTLHEPRGRLGLELCDDSVCREDSATLPDRRSDWPARIWMFDDDLDDFDEGEVTASAAVVDQRGDEIAARELTISLAVVTPHGPFCQEQLTGEMALTEADRLEH